MTKWLKTRRARAGFSFFGYGISIASNFFLANRSTTACGLVVLAALFTVYLFWPELRMLRLTVPKNYSAESPFWVYLFGLSSVAMLIFAFAYLYSSTFRQPKLLTLDEFSQAYISGKYFHLADLADSTATISDRTVEDCWVYGPAVISIAGGRVSEVTSFEQNDFIASMSGPMLIDWDKPLIATGVIKLIGCKFKRCHFVDISIMGPSVTLDQVRRGERGNVIKDVLK